MSTDKFRLTVSSIVHLCSWEREERIIMAPLKERIECEFERGNTHSQQERNFVLELEGIPENIRPNPLM